MIKIEGLKKSYAGRPVLQGIDLSVKAGEFLVVLGPSGAGKSTLLRCINGLAQPDAGRTVIDGKVLDLKRGAAGKRRAAHDRTLKRGLQCLHADVSSPSSPAARRLRRSRASASLCSRAS